MFTVGLYVTKCNLGNSRSMCVKYFPALSQARAQALHPVPLLHNLSAVAAPAALAVPGRIMSAPTGLEIAIIWFEWHTRETGDSIRPK